MADGVATQDVSSGVWNPVDAIKAKYPQMGLSDEQIYQNLSNPSKFRSAFPEYSQMSDGDIKTGIARFAPKYASSQNTNVNNIQPGYVAMTNKATNKLEIMPKDLAGKANAAGTHTVGLPQQASQQIPGMQYDEHGIPSGWREPQATPEDYARFKQNAKTGVSEVGRILGSMAKASGPPLPAPLPPEVQEELDKKHPKYGAFIRAITSTGVGPIAAGAGIAESMRTAGKQSIEQTKEAHAAKGDAVTKALMYGQAGVSGLSALNPMAAPSVSQINQLVKEGKGDEAATRGIVDALALGISPDIVKDLPPALRKVVEQREAAKAATRTEALSSLLDSKGGKVDTFEKAGSTVDAMRNEASRQGITGSQFKGREGNQLGLKLADDARAAHDSEVADLSKPYMQDRISTKPIADAQRALITDELRNNEPEVADRIEKQASKFDGSDTVANVDKFRERINKERNSFYRKSDAQKAVTDVEDRAEIAAVQAARKLQYEYVGGRAGVDPVYIKELMDREGHLIDVRNDLDKIAKGTSSTQSKAVSETLREKIFGTQGKPNITDLKAGFWKTMLGMKPVDVLNARLKTIFGDLQPYKPFNRPTSAPGGVPPIGPNMMGLPPQRGPFEMPASSIPEPKQLPPASFEPTQLHQPPIDQPGQVVPAKPISGRDVDTGQFKKFFGTSPKEALQDTPINQYPGVWLRATTEIKKAPISSTMQAAILKDLQNAMEQAKPQLPPQVGNAIGQANVEPKFGSEISAASSNANSPEAVQQLSEQAAQKLFNKPFTQLDGAQKLAAIREATNVQTQIRSEAGENVSSISNQMNIGALPERFNPIKPNSAESPPFTNPGDTEKFVSLKNKWARVNNQLLNYVDKPDSVEAKAGVEQLRNISSEINHLEVGDIGTPGSTRDVVIVGAGPGGLASAVMAASDGLNVTFIDANTMAGGQAKFSSRIENYPGFPVGVTGRTLAENMHTQATRLGAEAKLGSRVTNLEHDEATGLKTLTLDNGEKIKARSVIVAGGVEFKKMAFPGSEPYDSNIVYADGEKLSKLGKDKPVVVLGGSNGAAQAALGAAKDAKHVYVISRSPIEKGMSKYQVDALRNHDKISVIENDEIARLWGDEHKPLYAITKNGKAVPSEAMGVFIGSNPKLDWLPSHIAKEGGKLSVNGDLQTNIPGVFAIGDVRHGSIGRIGGAVGDGQMAERNVFPYLQKYHSKTVKK